MVYPIYCQISPVNLDIHTVLVSFGQVCTTMCMAPSRAACLPQTSFCGLNQGGHAQEALTCLGRKDLLLSCRWCAAERRPGCTAWKGKIDLNSLKWPDCSFEETVQPPSDVEAETALFRFGPIDS